MKASYKPLTFFTLSLILPWALWFTVAYWSHQPISPSSWWHISLELAGLLTPIVVAAILFMRNKVLLADLHQRFIGKGLLCNRYFWIAVLLPPISIVVAQILSLSVGHGLEQFYISGQPTFSSAPLSAWFVLCFAPIAEELAWHTYGTDALRQRYTLFTTSAIFTIYWGLWHLPLFCKSVYLHLYH